MGKNNVEEVGVRREKQVGREEGKKQIRQRWINEWINKLIKLIN